MALITIASVLKSIATAIDPPKVYVDMDGVLCDFEKAVKELGPGPVKGLPLDAEPKDKEVMWKAIDDAGADFWGNMSWKKDGKKVWNLVKNLNPVLLSSPGNQRYSPAGKQNWASKNLPGVPLFLETDKFQYAQGVENAGAILIDDMEDNISAWNGVGGKGILHKDFETTKEELKKLLK